MTKDMAFVIGSACASFGIAVLIMGIIYLIGWRQSPKWRKRFLWMTFAVAGVMNIRSKSLVLAIIFGTIAGLIWRIQRDWGLQHRDSEKKPVPLSPSTNKPKTSIQPPPSLGTNIATVTGTSANIRSGAGNEFPIITTVKQGDKLILLGEYGEWLNIRLENGQDGWINNRFVK